uniref:Uncharacterized protein n=1 Tax=Anguilla anguilla TaxID=7936 RepID=A0A0E9S2A2_ANGAN
MQTRNPLTDTFNSNPF